MDKHLIYKDKLTSIYNCSCEEFVNYKGNVDLVFADPPFGMDLTNYENVLMKKCNGHTFLMTNERVLIPFSNKYIDNFVRMYAINTVIPNLISNKAPMQLADFVSEFRFGKTKFVNNNECFSNLIESKKIRMMKQYSQNFDKQGQLFAFFFKHFTKEGDTILDPFCGSGKSIIVARALKRKIIAFETNKKSCNHIINILSQTKIDYK